MSIKAIPTTYKNIEFRSKSEAILARSMDLAGINIWEYEPKDYPGWYTPDFVISSGYGCNFLVEYKPKKPSSAYIENLKNWQHSSDIDEPLLIYWNNFYSSDSEEFYELIVKTDTYKGFIRTAIFELFLKKIWRVIEEAKKYRFDLEDSVAVEPTAPYKIRSHVSNTNGPKAILSRLRDKPLSQLTIDEKRQYLFALENHPSRNHQIIEGENEK